MSKALSEEEKQINKQLREWNKITDHSCRVCGKQVYSYEKFYTITTRYKVSMIFHAECMGKEIAKNATKGN